MRKKKLQPGQKIIYGNIEYIFSGYTKNSPDGREQRIDLKVEGEDYIVEMYERSLYEN